MAPVALALGVAPPLPDEGHQGAGTEHRRHRPGVPGDDRWARARVQVFVLSRSSSCSRSHSLRFINVYLLDILSPTATPRAKLTGVAISSSAQLNTSVAPRMEWVIRSTVIPALNHLLGCTR